MQGNTKLLDLKARPIAPSDFGDVAKFLSRTFGKRSGRFLEILHWLENNPVRDIDQPRGWMVESPASEPIAFTSNIPFAYIVNGQSRRCFATGNTSVAAEWRGRKLARTVAKAFLAQDDADLLIGMDSTAIAYRLWLSLGMKPLQRQWAGKSFRMVANARRLVRATAAPGALKPALGTTIAAIAAIARLQTLGRARSIKVRKLDSFDIPGADRVRRFRADIYADTYAIRSPAVLNWMYFGCELVRRNRAVFAATDRGRIVGYLAMKLVGDSFFLLECRCKEANPDIARALILAARDHADACGASFLDIWRYTGMIHKAVPNLCGTTFWSRPMMTYCYRSNVGAIDEQKWESTPGDGDLSVN